MMNIMMFVLLYPVMLIIYLVMFYCEKPKNGMAFGAVMKKEWLEDGGIQKIITGFRKEMKRNLVILAVIPFLCLFLPHISVQCTVWMLWMLAVIVAMELPYAKANKKVRNRKSEMGWNGSLKKEAYAELKEAGAVRKVRFLPFAVPILLSAAATAFAFAPADVPTDFGIMILCLALVTPLFYGAAVWMDRQKTEVISTDSDVNVNYARAKKNVWKNFWLANAWLNTVYVLAAAVSLITGMEFTGVILWGAVIYSLLMIFFGILAMKSVNNIENAYEARKDAADQTEDDSNWLWGLLYYNPRDRHTMVSKRVGIGTTVNVATPLGKGVMIICIAALLAIPFLCIWLILDEFTPISLAVSGDCLQAEHLKVDYEIPVSAIENLSLVEELPSWSKLSGTAMDNLEKGTFNVHSIGKCQVFVNPQNAVFLQFEADGTSYYMSGADDEETMEVYELLTGWD